MSAPAVEGPTVPIDSTEIVVSTPNHAKPSASAADYSDLPEPPGPFAWPGVGNMLSLLRHGGQGMYEVVLRRRYGDVVRAQILGNKWVFLFDPDQSREVLLGGKGREFTDRYLPPVIDSLIGNSGLIFANGPQHTANRRLTTPAFHRPEILDLASRKVLDLAKQLAARYKSLEAGTVVDVYDDMRSLTLDAISQASFSLPLGLVGGNKVDAHADGARMDRLIRGENRYLGRAARFLIPNAHKVGLNPAYRKLERVWSELAVIENGIIDERRKQRAAARANGETERLSARDLLDVYLEAIEGGDESSEDLTDDTIRQNVHSVFFAGSDTTATSISATLFEITKREDVLAKVVAEVQGLDLDNPSIFSPNTMPQRFPVLDACIKEALRLYPTLPSVNRWASRDTVIQGYRIEKGTVVAPSVYAIQRRKDIWGEDAEEFRPERWLGELEGGVPKGVPPSAYMPFGIGPRVCLGWRFALMETMIVVSVLLKSVRVRSEGGSEKELEKWYPGALNFPKGVPVVVG